MSSAVNNQNLKDNLELLAKKAFARCHTECCVGMCPIVKRLFLTLYAYRISSPLGML